MKEQQLNIHNQQVYYRLIALWVVCEALLGGVIHGLKLPISGLIVGSAAVICICLIAYYVPSKSAIIKATVIVAIFKMMLTPHSPPAAYIAVFFQGAVAQLLFYKKINSSNRSLNKKFLLQCMLLGFLALTESAIQRIIVLTVLYGISFWEAVDQYISKITGQTQVTEYSLIIAGSYITIHALIGGLVGWLAWHLIRKITSTSSAPILDTQSYSVEIKKPKRIKIFKPVLLITWLLLLLLFIQSAFGEPILSTNHVFQIILRSILIVLTWYFFIAPLMVKLMKKWLEHKQQKLSTDIEGVLSVLPSIQFIVIKSWSASAGKKGIKRLINYCQLVVYHSLQPIHE